MNRKKLLNEFISIDFERKKEILQKMIWKFTEFSIQLFSRYFYLYDEAILEKDENKLNEIYSSILNYIYENKQMKNIYKERKKKKSLQEIHKQEVEEDVNLEEILEKL